MELLSTEEAAALLRLNVKRIQSLARAGKLPTVRVGRKWLFPRQEIDKLLDVKAAANRPLRAQVEVSARNQLRGEIAALHLDGVMAEVRVRIGEQELVSVITRSSAERMRLKVGDPVLAMVKATEVMIGKE